MHFDTEKHEPKMTDLPLGLTIEAADQYPEAVALARSLGDDQVSMEPITQYLIQKLQISSQRADHALSEYVKYLVMVGATNVCLAPSDDADIAWHAHILHTQLYEPFCRRHFGRFIHHVPSEPNSHPTESFLRKQNGLGALFYGKNSIYRSSHGHCVNHHSCFGHVCSPGNACTSPGPPN
jgi:hypothetical protein